MITPQTGHTGKKAQATAFIIIGIIMVVLVSMMLSLTSQKQLAPLQKSASEIGELLRTESVRNYVELCLEKTAVQGIQQLAANGGELQPAPGTFMAFGGNQVKYWIPERATEEYYPSKDARIKPTSRKENEQQAQPPFDYWLVDKPDTLTEKRFPFGDLKIPALCQKGGPNDQQSGVAPPCPAGFSDTISIQGQLDDFITTHAKECINEEKIKQMGGFSIVNFTVEVPDVTVTIGEEDVAVDATYPVVVGIEKASREIVQYHISISARLKRIYGLVQDLMRRDRTELSFDVNENEHQKKSEYYDKKNEKSIDIEVSCPKCAEKKYDDAVSILDTASSLSGAPLVFNVARANRRPVLSFIHDNTDTGFKEGNFKPFDLLFEYGTPNTKIEFDVLAHDPDEDAIHFVDINTDEWNERLKEECWGTVKKDDKEEAIDLPEIDANELFENPPEDKGPLIANYKDVQELNVCRDDNVETVPSTWEVGAHEPLAGEKHAYRATIRRTDRALKPLDFGYHTMTVEICDDHDGDIKTKDTNALCDRQQLVILIVDKMGE